MLAQDASALIPLVKDSGPVVVAVVLLGIGIFFLWKLVGRPSLDSLITISSNFAKASSDLSQATNESKEILIALKAMREQRQRDRAAGKDPLHDSD